MIYNGKTDINDVPFRSDKTTAATVNLFLKAILGKTYFSALTELVSKFGSVFPPRENTSKD